jgi:predicted ferric reductase
MNHTWWHVARSTGLVAWLALAGAMASGGLLALRLVYQPAAIRRVVGIHRHLAATGLGLVGLHLSALLADTYVRFDLLDLIVPFRSPWRPTAVAWGIVSLGLLVVVEVSSLVHRRLSKRAWRMIHQSSALGFAAATVHLLQAGTEAPTAAVRLPVMVITSVVAFLYLGRLLTPRQVERRGVQFGHDNEVTSRQGLVQSQRPAGQPR